MAPGDGGPDPGIIAGINVTPLVDITLVLLIVFIVTAKIMVAPAVPLDLPRATNTDDVQVVLSVIIPLRGAVLVNGAAADGDRALIAQARDAITSDPEVRVVIEADGGVPHRRVIQVLDLLRQAGIARIAFAALPPDGASGIR